MTGSVEQNTVGGLSIAITGAVHGDFRVNSDRADYQLNEFPPAAPDVDDLLRRGPAALLLAASRVVDFIGREAELAELTDWLTSPAAVAVMLLHGPGGQGKTRLATKLAENACAEGWAVAEVRHHADPPTIASANDFTKQGRGLLMVLDYGERWSHQELKRYLVAGARHQHGPTRILVVARPSGLWWNTLRHPLRKANINATECALGPLAPSFADRQVVFTAARNSYAAILDVANFSELRPAGSLADDAYGLALTLNMAALVAVDACRRGIRQPTDPGELSSYLLDREYDSWRALFGSGRIGTEPPVLRQLVLLATLTGPTALPTALELVQAVGLADGQAEAHQRLRDHALCYPPEDTDRLLTPLAPDRIGEDFLADALSSSDDTTGAWSAQLLEWLVTTDGKSKPGMRASSAFGVLVQTGRRWDQVRRRHLFPLVDRYPDIIVSIGGESLVALAEVADEGVLRTIEPHLPPNRDPNLDAGIAAVARRLTEFGLRNTRDAATRGHLYKLLGIKLSHAGLHEDALDSTNHAVRIYREIVTTDAGTGEPELALCLNNRAVHLSNLGRRNEARRAAEEALDIRRQLYRKRPDAFAADLASSWNNLGLILSDLEEHREALEATTAAEKLYAKLAEESSAAFLPDLASAQNNLSVIHADLGHLTEALTLAENAAHIREQLAGRNAAYEPDHAMALHNLAGRYFATKHFARAAATGERAVKIYRSLAEANEHVFLPELAAALMNLGNYRSTVGQWEEALQAALSAAEMYRSLTELQPTAHQMDLGRSLTNLAARLVDHGDYETALAAAEEAVRIHEQIDAGDATEAGAHLATALTNLAVVLTGLGRHADGLQVNRRALEIYRRLTLSDPQAHRPSLARILTNLGLDLSDTGQWVQAQHAFAEAVEIWRSLSRENRDSFEPDLAKALHNAALPLTNAGMGDQASAAAEEAVAIRSRLAEHDPDVFEHELAASLTNLSIITQDVDRKRACDAAARAVEIYRRLAARAPARFLAEFARSLLGYGQVLGASGERRSEAASAVREAKRIYEELAVENPERFSGYVTLAYRMLTENQDSPHPKPE
ncbi:tetratricopeptide repeat protein [Nocardia barduliensis]|uniref:tetratricopeptide repeat protein n=1 Tax=Nocardia barduliensis TaxID=2736643 RepID=UPI001573978F|nr:tetratricopeptide repeat protein [Nocardia barduliensis]